MKKLLVASLALAMAALTACESSEPPQCVTQSLFYNDIPGCKEALAAWKAENPKAAVEFEKKQKEQQAILMGKFIEGILTRKP